MHPIRLPKRLKGPWRAVVAVLLDVVTSRYFTEKMKKA